MMPESSQRSASFQLIMETAEGLIQEKGCRQTTLQDIIDRSGLSKGAIYHYVSGKDELFGLILKSRLEKTNERFQQAVSAAAKGDAKAPIQSVAGSMMNGASEGNVSNKIFMYLLSQIDNPKVAAIMNDVYKHSTEMASRWIEAGQRAGAIPESVDAHRMASLYMVFSYGLRVHNLIAKDGDAQFGEQDVFQIIFRTLV